jgi:Protein of unknown function (DUF3386)
VNTFSEGWVMNRTTIGQKMVMLLVMLGMAITLAFTPPVVADPLVEPEINPAEVLLQTAYDRRYTWNEAFPGYEAEVAVKYQDSYIQGSVRLFPDLNTATKDIIDKNIRQVTLAQMQMTASQLQHTTFEEMHGQFEFKLIKNEEGLAEIEETKDDLSARYLVKDEEIIQVDRNLGEMTVQIRTIDSLKTPEGYLQTHFQATFRNPKTEEILEQDDIRDEFQKVGDYYLLAKREIRRGDGENWVSKLYPDTTLRFSTFQLLPQESSTQPDSN